jgi:carbonic anhydrase/acetyltransferase-like protein (isoleucine patch superfamily)
LGQNVLIASGARIIGKVSAGDETSFWFNVVARGDVQSITIGQRTNIQDNTVIHVTSKTGPCTIGDDVTIGHQAILHACTVGDRVLVGMGSVILDGAVIGPDTMIGAGSLISPGKTYPEKHLILGSPARAVRPLSDKELDFLRLSALQYIETAMSYRDLG